MDKKERTARPVPPARMRVAEALGKWFPDPEPAPKAPPVQEAPTPRENTAWSAGPKIRDHDRPDANED